MYKFRSIEFWKSSIMTLPDNAFFELLRTVFGKIKTPYNKQVLMGDLEKFLLRDNIIKNIACYISHSDALIITAVAALNEPTPDDLETFFAGELSFTALHDLIVNLEERFIIYRFFEEKQNRRLSRLALNPVLESILSPLVRDSSLLFTSIPDDEALDETTRDKPFLFDERILAALLSFVSQNKLFFRAGGGGIRQKVSNTAKTLFPGLPLETITGALQVLGLFFAEGETLAPDYHRFIALGGLSRHERLAYCAAGILCYADFRESDPSGAFSPWLFRAKVYNYAAVMSRLYSSMDMGRLYPHTTLLKLIYILEQSDARNDSEKIIDIMEKIGLIVRVSDKGWPNVPAWRKTPFTPPAKESVMIAMDTPFTLLVYPEIAYNDVISLAAFANIIEAGMTVRFEISRDSVVLAFNRGFSADVIIELLQRLSCNRINENLIFTLRDWEKRHGEVALRRGLVLTLAPEQLHLAQTRPLAKLIMETLAPGVYLLPESEEEKAAQALTKAGVTIIARREENLADEPPGGLLRNFFMPLHADKPPVDKTPPASPANDSSASILIERFHSILEQMRLGGEARDELSARIDRRLVLSESQLKDAVVRYEKLEARGLDYVGKALIAKQAIAMQSPVEVVWPGKQKQERVVGIPKVMEKAGSESILVVDPLGGDTGILGDTDSIPGDTVRIPLGKISLLRRIKKSIFEG